MDDCQVVKLRIEKYAMLLQKNAVQKHSERPLESIKRIGTITLMPILLFTSADKSANIAK